ncbi:MarR family transcriptional regulator, partial [Staphylococcus chromogenes]
VLLALWEESPQTVKSLGEKLDLSSNTLTPLLKRLEVAGWIQRIKNKKFLEIHLTDKAKRHEKEICDKLENSVQSIMDVQEYQRVRNELIKIEQTLKNEFDL